MKETHQLGSVSPHADGTNTELTGLSGAPRQLSAAPSYMDHDDGTYSVTFHKRPFGMHIGKTRPDQKNLFVTRNDPHSQAERGGVKNDAVIVKIREEEVEDLGEAVIGKIFGRAAKTLPITITFRAGTPKEVGREVPSKLSKKEGIPDVPPIISVPTMDEEEQEEMDNAELSVDDEPQSPAIPPAPAAPAAPAAFAAGGGGGAEEEAEIEYEDDEEYEYYDEEVEPELDDQAAVAVQAAFAEQEDEAAEQNLEELE